MSISMVSEYSQIEVLGDFLYGHTIWLCFGTESRTVVERFWDSAFPSGLDCGASPLVNPSTEGKTRQRRKKKNVYKIVKISKEKGLLLTNFNMISEYIN